MRSTREVDWTDEQARSILQVIQAVSSHRDRDALFKAIAAALRPVLSFDSIVIAIDGPRRDEVTPYFIEPRVVLPILTKTRSILGELFATGEPVHVPDRQDLVDRPASRKVLERLECRSCMALPLVVRGRVFAALLVHARRAGAYRDVDPAFAREVATAIAVALDHCITYETIARSRDRLISDTQVLRAQRDAVLEHDAVVAESPAMREVIQLVELVAATDATVLLSGETGSGKERLARLVQERSARADRPYVTMNCAAIPAGLIESELFGHEPGAFTGAIRRRRGRFELADGGTLFLDEIGELPFEAQAKLLRVLQDQQFERLGGAETLQVDVRVIAATNRDLRSMVEAGRFRGDLYYRLAVFPIELPPLWARREDIPILARLIVEQAARRMGRDAPYLDSATIARLLEYSWPGNVRELQNVLERAVILARGGMLDVASLLDLAPPHGEAAPERAGRSELERVLAECGWVIEGAGGAAARLGLHPSTLRSRLRRQGIERPR